MAVFQNFVTGRARLLMTFLFFIAQKTVRRRLVTSWCFLVAKSNLGEFVELSRFFDVVLSCRPTTLQAFLDAIVLIEHYAVNGICGVAVVPI